MARQARNPRRDNPEVRREQILEEAISILGRLGYHGFTIHELAERCGLSNAGLLYHFPSKNQLFVAVVQELEQREIQALAPLIAVLERDERRGVPLAAIIDLLHAMVSRGGTRPELVRFYAVLQSESLDQGHPAHDSFRTRESAVLELFTRLVLPYVAEPRSTARQLLALLDGLRLQWLREHQNFDVVTEWVRAVVLLVPALAPLAEKHGLASGVKAKRRPLPEKLPMSRKPKLLSGTAVVLPIMAASLFLFGSWRAAAAGPAHADGAEAAAGDRCARLAGLNLDQVVIESAKTQPAQAPVSGANLPSMTGAPGAGAQVTGLPAFCRVIGSMHPEAGSDIRFEVWMPQEGWDGRFNGANSGGLAGYINYNDLAAGIRAGQAVAGSDTGHKGSPGDAAWAKGHPEKVRDYGWRGVHLTAVVGKKLVAAYYGRSPDHSYFIGCSNGGRQALMEASRFPEDYDGIVAGAPAIALTDVTMSMVNAIQAQLPPGAVIRPEQAQLLQNEVLKQCDAIDGQTDGLIADPRQCKFDAAKLACGVSDSPQCFAQAQIKALEQIYAGVHDKSGRRVAFGYPPSGAEVGNPVPAFGWEANILANFQAVSGGKTLSEGILTDLPQSPIATDATFDFNRDPARLEAALAADLDAQPDLGQFFARGGKLIMWHGWADPILPPEPTVSFREAVLRKSGSKAKDQLKLFMVPGVQHCVGGTGPDALGQIGAPLPSEQPERSVGAAIQAWVETKRVPDSIVGRRGMIAMAMNPGAPERQRLICAYPAHAVLRSGADPDKAASYDCRS